jgi:hypothetical protein
MAITTERYQGTLTTAAVAVLSSNPNEVWTISKALVLNTTGVSVTVSIYDDTAGSGAASGNLIYGPVSVSPSETKVLPLSALAEKSGGKLWALASANTAINMSITYTKTAQ